MPQALRIEGDLAMSKSGTKGLVIMSSVILLVIAIIAGGIYIDTPGYRLPAAIEKNPSWENYKAYAEHLEREKNYKELASVLVEAEKQLTNFRPLNYIERLENEVGGAFTQHLPSEYETFFALKDGGTEGYDDLVAKLESERRYTFLDDVYYWAYSSGIARAANDLLAMLNEHPASVQMHPQDLLSIGAKELVEIYEPTPSNEKAEEINRLFAQWQEAIEGYDGLHDGFYCEDDHDTRPDRAQKLVLLQYFDERSAHIHYLTGKPKHIVDLSENRGYEGFVGEKRVGWVVQNETTASSYYFQTTSEKPPSLSVTLGMITTGEYTSDTFELVYLNEFGDIAASYFQDRVGNCNMVTPFEAEFMKQLMMSEERALADSM